MVRVRYCAAEPFLEMRGHAGGGRCGEDLICAAVSILAHTLGSSVPGTILSGKAVFRGGDAKVYETIWKGLKLLERQYPDNVRCERIAKTKWGGQDGK